MNRSPYLGRILVRRSELAALSAPSLRPVRLNPVVDRRIDPGANNIVRILAVQADGKILVSGDFITVDRDASE
jgi:hypothetical protein